MAEGEMTRRPFQIVVAATRTWGIGREGGLPWHLPSDLKYFKELTCRTRDAAKRNAVVMGRKTWESLPERFRPLPGRLNVVLTRQAGATTGESESDDENSSPREAGSGAARGAASPREGLGKAATTPPRAPTAAYPPSVLTASSLGEALGLLARPPHANEVETVFLIGGGAVFDAAVASPLAQAAHVTVVERAADGVREGAGAPAAADGSRAPPLGSSEIPCDVTMPALDPTEWALWSSSAPKLEAGLSATRQVLVRRRPAGGSVGEATGAGTEGRAEGRAGRGDGPGGPAAAAPHPPPVPPAFLPPSCPRHGEQQYLDLVAEVLRDGVKRGDRTGTGTLALFGRTMRFDLRSSFPLLTTKRVFWRGVAEELLWFVSGSTDARALQAKGISIWDGNGSREFLDSVGLKHREPCDLGPVYGFQWRHFGAAYEDMHTDYSGRGVDQLRDIIDRIRRNPTDRRLILTAWNPAALHEMALPPCHLLCQFFIANGELSCQMYQRSCDLGLGVPFNIASYALLVRLIAQVCGLKPGELVHVLGDAHVYLNHVDALERQLANPPRPFPTLDIDPSIADIDAFEFKHFTLRDYDPFPAIKMKMAV